MGECCLGFGGGSGGEQQWRVGFIRGRGSAAVGLVLLHIADAVDSLFTRGTLANKGALDHLYFRRGLGNPCHHCSRATNSWWYRRSI